jgi:hypothetical protein
MQPAFQAQGAAIVAEVGHAVPVRRWHATGHFISILSSLGIAAVIGVFFFALRGWSPPEAWQIQADFSVTWLLLTYIWVQMGSLILVGSGTKNQMWLDAFTSVMPLFLIFYVLIQHYSGYIELSHFQAKTASVTAYTMLLDFVVDSAVPIALSQCHPICTHE